jgi:hypothetical protein
MENNPGRGGAVTGGAFDQSKAPDVGCLLAVPVEPAAAGAGWVVGATVVFPEGGASAAKPSNAIASVAELRQKLKTDLIDFAHFADGKVIVCEPLLLESWR